MDFDEVLLSGLLDEFPPSAFEWTMEEADTASVLWDGEQIEYSGRTLVHNICINDYAH